MTEEEWRPVAGYEGFYEVSSLGRVRSYHGREVKVLRGQVQWTGYERTVLQKNGIRKEYQTHRLVAAAFVGSRPDGWDVNHKSNIRNDNRAENLEYLTRRDNIEYQRTCGTLALGERNGNAKLDRFKVLEIRRRHALGENRTKLAAEFGVTKYNITKVVSRENWASV